MSIHNPASKSQASDFEKLLYKIIIQFSLFNHGLEEKLDPHLDEIRKLLKTGFEQQKMQPVLLEMSGVLAKLGNANSKRQNNQSNLVFDYLASTTQDKAALKAIENIKLRYKNNEFPNAQNLFDAIKLVTRTATGQPIDTVDVSAINHKDIFRARFNTLLNTIDIPPQFNFGVDILKQRTKKPLSDTAYQKVIEDSIKLLLNIKQHSDKEQNGIGDFLAEIHDDISEIEDHANLVSESTLSLIQSHQNFTTELSAQVDNIKSSSSTALELSSLQKNINKYLAEITSRLDKHKLDEETRQQDTQEQFASMQNKLQKMEAETSELKSHLKLAHDKALHDPLTGIPNRLAYNERVEMEQARWKRYKQPLCLIVWDIDHFKAINDTHGHKSGDRTLSLIAQLIINNCRDIDFIARYGGEEFVMLLPNTNIENAPVLAESIREIISKSGFNANGNAITMTISCGISEFTAGDNHETVFERADKALYLAKQQGRNRCVVG